MLRWTGLWGSGTLVDVLWWTGLQACDQRACGGAAAVVDLLYSVEKWPSLNGEERHQSPREYVSGEHGLELIRTLCDRFV